jgi:hypothetical protein
MGLRRLGLLVVAAAMIASAVAAMPAGAIETPLPGDPPPYCGAYYPGNCLITTGNGGLTISPKIVRAGGELTGNITNRCSENNVPCPVGWSGMLAVGKRVHGCEDKDSVCVVKIPRGADSSDYQVINITVTSGVGAGYSSDYFAVVGRHQAEIQGRVSNKDDEAVGSVAVNMYGRANNVYHATTGPDGQYAAFVKAGHYRVFPESKSVPSKGRVKFTPDSSDVHAPANGKATADFKLDGGLVVELKLSKSSVPADGLEVVQATVHVTQYGKPVSGQTVELWPQDDESSTRAVTSGARVLMCTPGNRIWPTGSLQDPDGLSVNETTDPNGNYTFTLFAGTVPGTWKLTAWAKDASGALITHDLTDTSDDQTLTVTPLGSPAASVEDFVNAYNTYASGTGQETGNNSNISTMLTYFWPMSFVDSAMRGLAYAPVQGNSGAVLIYQASSTPNIAANGTVTPRTTDEVLEPSEWTSVPGDPASSLNAALQQGKLQQLPDYSQWSSGQSVPGWTGGAQTMSTTSGAFQYFGWPLPSTAAGTCS